MKKALIIVLGLGLTFGAMAQTEPVKKEEMKDLKTHVREKKVATHRVNHDLSHAKVKRAVRDHKAVAVQNKDIHRDAKGLKNRKVGHPIVKAKRQIKAEDDARKDHTN